VLFGRTRHRQPTSTPYNVLSNRRNSVYDVLRCSRQVVTHRPALLDAEATSGRDKLPRVTHKTDNAWTDASRCCPWETIRDINYDNRPNFRGNSDWTQSRKSMKQRTPENRLGKSIRKNFSCSWMEQTCDTYSRTFADLFSLVQSHLRFGTSILKST